MICFDYMGNNLLSEETRLGAMLVVSFAVHLMVFSLLIYLPGLPSRSLINPLPQYTSVRLVGLSDLTGRNTTGGSLHVKKAKKKIIAREPVLVHKKVKIKKLQPSKKTISEKSVVSKKAISPESKKKEPRQNNLSNAQEDQHLYQSINNIKEKIGGGGSVTAVASGLRGGIGIGDIPEMTVYTSIVVDRIMQAWFLPPGLKEEALNRNLLTIIDIRINRKGNVNLKGIERRSANSFYDDYAVAAINKIRSESFPPLPDVFRQPYLDLGIRFHPSKEN